jgi:hypothetical protein
VSFVALDPSNSNTSSQELEWSDMTGKEIVYVECRKWFDKANGNTYFAAKIYVDGHLVADLPFQYGYGEQYLYESLYKLIELGIIPEKFRSNNLTCACHDLGIVCHYSEKHVKRESDIR